MKRRNFLLGTAAFGGALATNTGINSLTFAQAPGRTKTIVKVFQRGGADGLHLFPPIFDDNYYNARSSILVERPNSSNGSSAQVLQNINGTNPRNRRFGLNPNLMPLLTIWDEGNLAVSPATHYENSTRSHFAAQVFLETANNGTNLNDGLFNRYLQVVNPQLNDNSNQLRAIRAGVATAAPAFFGEVSVPSINDASSTLQSADFCSGSGCSDNQLTEMLRNIGKNETDNELENHIRRADVNLVDTTRVISASNNSRSSAVNAGGLDYTDTDIGRGLRLVAQLLKDGQPLEVASVNWANVGWDTHAGHVAPGDDIRDDSLATVRGVKDGANDLLTFYLDMKNNGMLDDVVVIVGSEFGRTVEQNGSNGTDHGYGSTWFTYGGRTKGGIYGAFESLETSRLEQGRYVPHIVSYQDILGEAFRRHMRVSNEDLRRIFPSHNFTDHRIYTA